MQIEETPFNLAEKLRTVIHSFSELAAQKPLLLSLDIDPAMAPWIMGDSLRLHQVLNNFLSNAVKFTEHGQVSLSVHLEQTTAQHTAQQTLLFQVKDTGIGISQEGVQRLFQDFSQVDASTSRRFGGTGLGLAICKKMIELMGGQIGVNSQVDQGSCFWFRLPYRCAQVPTLDAPQPHKTQFTQAQAAHILLVDDNLINRQIGDKILQKLGHQVTLADSGFAALTACQQQDFDLILMDCQMPDMDGYETTQKLRQALYRQPIIALTANTSQEDQELAKLSGMNDFVSKPFNPDKLQQTIQAWLSHV
jgi:CheY-like chemotaxis protein